MLNCCRFLHHHNAAVFAHVATHANNTAGKKVIPFMELYHALKMLKTDYNIKVVKFPSKSFKWTYPFEWPLKINLEHMIIKVSKYEENLWYVIVAAADKLALVSFTSLRDFFSNSF